MRLSRKRKHAIVARMIELLDRPYGWTRGSWRRTRNDGVVQFCMLGAVQQAYTDVTGKKTRGDGGDLADELSIVALLKAKGLGPDTTNPTSRVIGFNDKKTTKKADVLAILREKEAELA
jgi:hypothetical protein